MIQIFILSHSLILEQNAKNGGKNMKNNLMISFSQLSAEMFRTAIILTFAPWEASLTWQAKFLKQEIAKRKFTKTIFADPGSTARTMAKNPELSDKIAAFAKA